MTASPAIATTPRQLRLDLRMLCLSLGQLRNPLVDPLLKVTGADQGKLAVPCDLIARLNIAHAAIGASRLMNPLNKARGFECEIHLRDRRDQCRVEFRRIRLNGLNNTRGHGLYRLFGFRMHCAARKPQRGGERDPEALSWHLQFLPRA